MQKNHAEGRQDILADDVRKIERELNDDMFKDAALKYHNKIIELRVRTNSRRCSLSWRITFLQCQILIVYNDPNPAKHHNMQQLQAGL